MQPSMVYFGAVAASSLFDFDEEEQQEHQEQQEQHRTEHFVNTKTITLTNHSLTPQTMKLVGCSSDAMHVRNASGNGASETHDEQKEEWRLGPGEQIDVEVVFHPEMPQVLYHGELLFQNVSSNTNSSTTSSNMEDQEVLMVNARGYGAGSQLIIQKR